MSTKIIEIESELDAANAISQLLQTVAKDVAAKQSSRLNLAISGGSFLNVFAKVSLPMNVISNYTIAFADERCVPFSSKDSTYATALKVCSSIFNLPQVKIIHIDENLVNDPRAAAKDYQEKLLARKAEHNSFNIVFLGIGEDGHTASLFPVQEKDNEREELCGTTVIPVFSSPKPPSNRISLNYRAILNSDKIVFVARGKDKANILKKIIHDKDESTPAGKINVAAQDKVLWIVDRQLEKII